MNELNPPGSSGTSKQQTIQALQIAILLFERVIARFGQLFTDVVDKVLKKFYTSMKSKFLRERMSVSSISVFHALLQLRNEIITLMKHTLSTMFTSETKMKQIDPRDFLSFEEATTTFVSLQKTLIDLIKVEVQEAKLDKSLSEKYLQQVAALHKLEPMIEHSRQKLLQDYFKILYNKWSASVSQGFGKESWIPLEPEFSLTETLTCLYGGQFLNQDTKMLLNESAMPGDVSMVQSGPEVPILVFKNEVLIEKRKFRITQSFQYVLEAVKHYLQLGGSFLDSDPEILSLSVKRVSDIFVLNSSLTTQYILSGGAVVTGILAKVTGEHLALALSQLGLAELIMSKLQELILPLLERDIKTRTQEIFKKLTNDIEALVTSVQTKWADMFFQE